MRIIAGRWRGRRIAAPPGRDVRPTADRVREAWMSILRDEIPGATVLDLCAGSGALGLEALSRGAESVTFVEQGSAPLRVLRANIDALGASEAVHVRRADALSVARETPAGRYDLAFADPPYASDLADALAAQWREVPFAWCLAIEHAARHTLPVDGLDADTRRYGDTAITFLRARA
ncbi:MAG: 16S rRNA (guanine(966)-N(2))-methyltransferase RsmD [Gemmatimonadaceae bacterium]|jgi:16S rRNA (guanine966-N2)-methyltransferase|nr:16S rRNA (guanine(966)-N(2))-methyltransferase RsmD [Gemmatimonadaceae bacterium]